MDRRFLIYEDFEYDVESIFEDLIARFNFIVTDKSDSGVFFKNSAVLLEVFYETGVQIWIKTQQPKSMKMLYSLVKEKKLEEQFFEIIGENFYKDRKGSLKRLSQFLVEHFSDELS
ncbi:MAG: hypothetical protein ACOCWM_05015 [Cyclobacteriaceae bacterium]